MGRKKAWMVEHVALHSWIIWHTTHPSFLSNCSPARKEEEECVAGERERKEGMIHRSLSFSNLIKALCSVSLFYS